MFKVGEGQGARERKEEKREPGRWYTAIIPEAGRLKQVHK